MSSQDEQLQLWVWTDISLHLIPIISDYYQSCLGFGQIENQPPNHIGSASEVSQGQSRFEQPKTQPPDIGSGDMLPAQGSKYHNGGQPLSQSKARRPASLKQVFPLLKKLNSSVLSKYGPLGKILSSKIAQITKGASTIKDLLTYFIYSSQIEKLKFQYFGSIVEAAQLLIQNNQSQPSQVAKMELLRQLLCQMKIYLSGKQKNLVGLWKLGKGNNKNQKVSQSTSEDPQDIQLVSDNDCFSQFISNDTRDIQMSSVMKTRRSASKKIDEQSFKLERKKMLKNEQMIKSNVNRTEKFAKLEDFRDKIQVEAAEWIEKIRHLSRN